MGAGNERTYVLAGLATGAVGRHAAKWTLQHRNPYGSHWVVLGQFPSKALAEESAKAFVTADYGPAEDFRVRRSKEPAA
jgi:hypothetical protein